MDFLKRIQSKSSDAKARYAFGIAGIITALIAAVWVSTVSVRFDTLSSNTKPEAAEQNSLSNLVSDTKTQVGNIIDSVADNTSNSEDAERMNALNMNEINAPEMSQIEAGTTTAPNSEKTPPPSTAQTPPAQPSGAPPQPEYAATTSTPRVILIATSTSQKSE